MSNPPLFQTPVRTTAQSKSDTNATPFTPNMSARKGPKQYQSHLPPPAPQHYHHHQQQQYPLFSDPQPTIYLPSINLDTLDDVNYELQLLNEHNDLNTSAAALSTHTPRPQSRRKVPFSQRKANVGHRYVASTQDGGQIDGNDRVQDGGQSTPFPQHVPQTTAIHTTTDSHNTTMSFDALLDETDKHPGQVQPQRGVSPKSVTTSSMQQQPQQPQPTARIPDGSSPSPFQPRQNPTRDITSDGGKDMDGVEPMTTPATQLKPEATIPQQLQPQPQSNHNRGFFDLSSDTRQANLFMGTLGTTPSKPTSFTFQPQQPQPLQTQTTQPQQPQDPTTPFNSPFKTPVKTQTDEMGGFQTPAGCKVNDDDDDGFATPFVPKTDPGSQNGPRSGPNPNTSTHNNDPDMNDVEPQFKTPWVGKKGRDEGQEDLFKTPAVASKVKLTNHVDFQTPVVERKAPDRADFQTPGADGVEDGDQDGFNNAQTQTLAPVSTTTPDTKAPITTDGPIPARSEPIMATTAPENEKEQPMSILPPAGGNIPQEPSLNDSVIVSICSQDDEDDYGIGEGEDDEGIGDVGVSEGFPEDDYDKVEVEEDEDEVDENNNINASFTEPLDTTTTPSPITSPSQQQSEEQVVALQEPRTQNKPYGFGDVGANENKPKITVSADNIFATNQFMQQQNLGGFGNSSQPIASPFGNFGQTPATTTTPFGATPSSFGLFGQSPQSTFTTPAPSGAFGQPTSTTAQNTAPFVQAAAPTPFTTTLGQQPTPTKPQQPQFGFGFGPTTTPQPMVFSFGKPQADEAKPAATQPVSAPVNTNPFGFGPPAATITPTPTTTTPATQSNPFSFGQPAEAPISTTSPPTTSNTPVPFSFSTSF
jgi:hypothetical protein